MVCGLDKTQVGSFKESKICGEKAQMVKRQTEEWEVLGSNSSGDDCLTYNNNNLKHMAAFSFYSLNVVLHPFIGFFISAIMYF